LRRTSSPAESLPTKSAANRRQRRSAEIRERLFRAALKLFAKQGFAETTVEDITNAADVGKGTFFNYFRSKEHIVLEFGELQFAKLKSAVASLRNSDRDVRTFLLSLPAHMTEEPIRNPAIVRILLQGFLSGSAIRELMLELHHRVQALHAEIMQIGQHRGEVRTDFPAEELGMIFRQSVFGTLLVWSLVGDESLAKRIESTFRVLWTGLAQRNSGGAALVESSEEERQKRQ
jgi:AcrR family transcriptional regulator